MTPTGGIILVDSIHSRVPRVRSVGAKAMAQAAGTAMIKASSTEPPAMMIELSAWWK